MLTQTLLFGCSEAHMWDLMAMLPRVWQVNNTEHYCKNKICNCKCKLIRLDETFASLSQKSFFCTCLQGNQVLALHRWHFNTHLCTLCSFGLPRQWSNRLWHFGTCCISCLPNLAAGTSHFPVQSAKSLQCLVGNGLLQRQCAISCWSLSLPCQC